MSSLTSGILVERPKLPRWGCSYTSGTLLVLQFFVKKKAVKSASAGNF